MAKMRRALVIGGSMSGLLAALALARRGWEVAIHERVAEPLAGRGAGIVAQPELKAALRALGLDADHDLGVEVPVRVMLARDGSATHRVECSQTMTAWDRVFHLLKAALPDANYHQGRELRRIAQGEQVVAHFADGSRAEADVSDRRRRDPLDRAPAISARGGAALCRLHGVARAGAGVGVPARTSSRVVYGLRVLPARERADARLSGGGSRQRPAPRPSPLQFRLVPAGQRRTRAAAALDRR